MLTLVRLALRDLSHQRAFAAFFIVNLALGVGGALLLDALQGSVERTLAARSRSMLGADVRVAASRELTGEEIATLDRIAGVAGANDRDGADRAARTADLVQLYSMVSGPELSRLTEVRGIDGAFPLAGRIELAEGGEVDDRLRARLAEHGEAWADRALLERLGIALGETVKVGSGTFRVVDTVVRDTGLSVRAAALAPRLYVALSRVNATGLVGLGSRVQYQHLFALGEGADADRIALALDDAIDDPRVRAASHAQAAAEISGAYDRVTRYLGLISLVALSLAAVACAYLFRAFLRRRVADLAVLISLGARRGRAQALLLTEVVLLAAAGALVGIAVVALALPLVAASLADVLPDQLRVSVGAAEASIALAIALVVGPASCLPLLARLRSLRVAELFQDQARISLSRARYEPLLYLPAVAALFGAAAWRTGDLRRAGMFVGGLAVAFLAAAVVGRVLLPLLAWAGERAPVAIRIGLRSLAPRRRGSLTAFVALTLGALLFGLPPQLESLLSEQLEAPGEGEIPSLFLFDIQPEQADPLRRHVREQGSDLQRLSPMVRARLVAIGDRSIDGSGDAGRFASGVRDAERLRRRRYNLTYQDGLHSTERIVDGRDFSGAWDPSGDAIAEMSMEIDFARRLGVGVGEVLTFDVQGVPVTGRIVNLREVAWTSLQPNFFVSFQPGVLEPAPSVFLASVPALSPERRERLQSSIVDKFPNVSVLDLSRTVARALALLGQLQWAVSATAWTALAVGLALVFAIARDEADIRRDDFNLMKVLGARHTTLRGSVGVEFGVLAATAGTAGTAACMAACAALAAFVLNAAWSPAWWPAAAVLASLTVTVVVTARLAMRTTLRARPRLR